MLIFFWSSNWFACKTWGFWTNCPTGLGGWLTVWGGGGRICCETDWGIGWGIVWETFWIFGGLGLCSVLIAWVCGEGDLGIGAKWWCCAKLLCWSCTCWTGLEMTVWDVCACYVTLTVGLSLITVVVVGLCTWTLSSWGRWTTCLNINNITFQQEYNTTFR